MTSFRVKLFVVVEPPILFDTTALDGHQDDAAELL